jgi:hypothetical protein
MSLSRLLKSKRIARQATSAPEIARLLDSAGHFVKNANVAGLESTAKFLLAYGAALDLAMVILRAGGFKTRGMGHHETAFEALAYLMGAEGKGLAKYLQTCREKRNRISYDNWTDIPETETKELLKQLEAFRTLVVEWLKAKHPTLSPKAP